VVNQAGYGGRGTDPAWSPLLDAQPVRIGASGPDACPA
jgi:TolB protein